MVCQQKKSNIRAILMEISTVQLLRLPVTNTNIMEQCGPETILMTCIGLISGISKLILLLILMS